MLRYQLADQESLQTLQLSPEIILSTDYRFTPSPLSQYLVKLLLQPLESTLCWTLHVLMHTQSSCN